MDQFDEEGGSQVAAGILRALKIPTSGFLLCLVYLKSQVCHPVSDNSILSPVELSGFEDNLTVKYREERQVWQNGKTFIVSRCCMLIPLKFLDHMSSFRYLQALQGILSA